MEIRFRELDDLVLNLKGLVLVRALREQRGADDGELALYSAEIERVRDRLASLVGNKASRIGEGVGSLKPRRNQSEEETSMTVKRQSASEQITEEVTAWPGVTAGPGARGEFSFRVGGREIGHLHGNHAAHFSFTKELSRELRERGRIDAHPVFPGKGGPGARRIANDADVRDVVELMRLNYERAIARARALEPAR